MAFTDAEKDRIRYHMGYMSANSAASFQLGVPRTIQAAFLVDTAVTLVRAEAEERVRHYIQIMDNIECMLVEALDRLAAVSLGDLKLNPGETDMLEEQYAHWGFRLADVVGAPLNPFSVRYQKYFNNGSIPVQRG